MISICRMMVIETGKKSFSTIVEYSAESSSAGWKKPEVLQIIVVLRMML